MSDQCARNSLIPKYFWTVGPRGPGETPDVPLDTGLVDHFPDEFAAQAGGGRGNRKQFPAPLLRECVLEDGPHLPHEVFRRNQTISLRADVLAQMPDVVFRECDGRSVHFLLFPAE